MRSQHLDVLDRDVVGYDPTSGTYHVDHDWEDRTSLIFTILRAVAAVTGEELRELDPLSSVVDPDALERVFEPGRGRGGPAVGCLLVEYNGCMLRLFADGHVVIDPPDDA